jgi:diamine N-acetyltransferase
MSDEPRPIPINVRGTKVALGPFLREQVAVHWGWLQDPEIAVHGNGSFELRSLERSLDGFANPTKNEMIFSVYTVEDLTFIGETLLMEIDHRQGTATFGITIGRKEYWGQGYGTEATRLMLDYGFRFLNLHNIMLITTSFNIRAQRAYAKAGFKEIGRRRGSLLVDGRRYDDIYMDCLATEFESPQPGWFALPE